jgi:hypothetical protein
MRLVASKPGRIRRQDAGVLRHPVFARFVPGAGEVKVWTDQKIPAGWFSDPTRAAQPDIRRSTEAALRRVVAQIEVDTRRGR